MDIEGSDNTHVSQEEKEQLSLAMRKLEDDDVVRLLHIINAREPHLISSEDIVIDFDAMKPSTFRELESYVASCCLKKQPDKFYEGSEVEEMDFEEDKPMSVVEQKSLDEMNMLTALESDCQQSRENTGEGSDLNFVSYEEKKEPVQQYQYTLRGEELRPIIQIIAKNENHLDLNPEELAFDFRLLKPSTMIEIAKYLYPSPEKKQSEEISCRQMPESNSLAVPSSEMPESNSLAVPSSEMPESNSLAVPSSESAISESLPSTSSASQSTGHGRTKKSSTKPMSTKKTRQLIHNIYKLSSDEVRHVLHIIETREPHLISDSLDMEVNFETLKPSTLREIKNYVSSCLKKDPSKSDSGTSQNRAERHCYKGLKKMFANYCRCSD